MPTPLQPATPGFNDAGALVSTEFDDVFHSDGGHQGPWGQAEEVFLRGNGLLGDAARWKGRRHFTILETGFGIGLNFIAASRRWLADPSRGEWLHFVSLEKHPFLKTDLERVWQRIVQDDPARRLTHELITHWPLPVPGLHRLSLAGGRIRLTLALGEAAELLPRLTARADALFLDGFSPRKNPALWTPQIFSQLARLCARDATLATWSAASSVRAGLADAGFEVSRKPGFGAKRHRLEGRYAGHVRSLPPAFSHRHALVVGAGLAGCGVAHALARRGWQVTLLDSASGPATGASGNPAGSFHPVMARDDNLLARLTRNAFLNALPEWARLHERHPFDWARSGALQVASERRRGAGLPPVEGWPAELVRAVDAIEARRLTGLGLREGGLWFPQAGWLAPAALCQSLLADAGEGVTQRFSTPVTRLARTPHGWELTGAQGPLCEPAPVVVLANAAEAAPLLRNLETHENGAAACALPGLPLACVRGQVSLLDGQSLPGLLACICGSGYLLPPVGGRIVAGATYAPGDTSLDVREEDHEDNLRRVRALLDPEASAPEFQLGGGRAGLRCVTPDRLPVMGAVPDPSRPGNTPSRLPRLPGLYVASGFASRGILWSSLAGNLLAAQLEGEPLPIEADLAAAIDPGRFALRSRQKT